MAHQIMNFEGLKFYERNSFLHFIEDLEEPSRASRSRSVPAMARRSLESPALAPSPCAVATTSTTLSQIDDGLEWMEKGEFLTLMIRGIPCSCKRDEILKAIEELGFSGRYDFFFTPMKKGRTLGYGFIGFPEPQLAKDFAINMTGYRFSNKLSSKVVSVTPATIQGLSKNLAHFRDTSVMQSDASKPFFQE